MKKIFFSLIAYFWMLHSVWASQGANYKDEMLPWNGAGDKSAVSVLVWWWDSWEQVDNFLAWIRDSIDTLLPITAIWVFLFVGIRLGIARWNPEEFKKAWIQFIYAIVGIFVVSFAWAWVKLVQGINIF